jgi:HK97 family phage major capsid protein
MDNLKAKREERVTLEDAYAVLASKAKEKTLSADEVTSLDSLDKKIASLDSEIEVLERAEKRASEIVKRQAAAVGAVQDNSAEVKEMNKIGKNYSFAKQIQGLASKKDRFTHEGIEAEMFQEAQKEAKEAGVSISGNIAIPSKFIKIGATKAAVSVGSEGTDVVATDLMGLIPVLNPNPIVSQLGITTMTGLRGNVQWPRHSTDVAFSWETETSAVDESVPAYNNISISPKRTGMYVDVTSQMMLQSSFVLEQHLRNIITRRYELTVDDAVLSADGTGNKPTGIMYYSGVNILSLGSGSNNNMTYAALVSMIRDAKVANARNGNAGFVTNGYGEYALSQTPKQTSGVEGNFVYDFSGRLVGRPLFVTEVIPSNLSEGGQSDLCGIIYGNNWQGAVLGTWGGLDILFDPYTQALAGTKRFVVNAFMDVEIEQPKEFTVCLDWDATDLPGLT